MERNEKINHFLKYEHSDYCANFFWLFSSLVTPPQNQCPKEDLDEACLFIEQQFWRILPVVMPRFLSWVGEEAENTSCIKQLKQKMTALEKYARSQVNFISHIADLFKRKEIPYAFLKSSATRLTAYSHPYERFGFDIDIAVPINWIEQCKSLVKEIGFETAQWNNIQKKYEKANPIARKVFESRSYELGFFVYRLELENISIELETAIRNNICKYPELWFISSDNKIGCYQTLDVHHGLNHERSISVEALVEDCCTIEIKGINHNVPRQSWLLLHLICKIYFEKSYKQILYQYADVYHLVFKMSYEEYEHFFALLDKYNLKNEALSVLQKFKHNSEILLPEQFATLLYFDS